MMMKDQTKGNKKANHLHQVHHHNLQKVELVKRVLIKLAKTKAQAIKNRNLVEAEKLGKMKVQIQIKIKKGKAERHNQVHQVRLLRHQAKIRRKTKRSLQLKGSQEKRVQVRVRDLLLDPVPHQVALHHQVHLHQTMDDEKVESRKMFLE